MMKSLISHEQLSKAKRLLYMTHMAMGDYVYQRMFLKKLKSVYPNLSIDLWFDNCSAEEGAWNLRRSQTLTEWFREEPFLNQLYPVAASLAERQEMIARAKKEAYDFIIFSVDFWCEDYARVAREMANHSFVAGTWVRPHRETWQKYKAFKSCDDYIFTASSLNIKRAHITEYYQKRFEQFFGLKTTFEEIRPHLEVPAHWQQKMKTWLEQEKQVHNANKGTVLINYLSTNPKRDWSFEQARELIIRLNERESGWTYILNLAPAMFSEVTSRLQEDKTLNNIHIMPFSAQEHFYELPALIQLCDWVLSVETAVIHLASALSIPQIALVRRKGKAWAPLPNDKTHVIFTKPALHSRISQITVDNVLECYRKKILKRPR